MPPPCLIHHSIVCPVFPHAELLQTSPLDGLVGLVWAVSVIGGQKSFRMSFSRRDCSFSKNWRIFIEVYGNASVEAAISREMMERAWGKCSLRELRSAMQHRRSGLMSPMAKAHSISVQILSAVS